MESLEIKIKKFLSLNYGSGDGSGDGSGYGSGHGSGDGSGSGSGYGFGHGSGDGSGDGSGYGYGYGSGYGSGDGSGDGDGDGSGSGSGSGYGFGYGSGVINFCGNKVYQLDGVSTIITSVKGHIAKGYILNNDLTTKDCFIVRVGNSFAHGQTLKQAQKDAKAKHALNSPVEERVKMFLKAFKNVINIPAKELFYWHFNLTGSCELGRESFVASKGIDLDTDQFTIQEFINLTRNAYGSEVIRELEKAINN